MTRSKRGLSVLAMILPMAAFAPAVLAQDHAAPPADATAMPTAEAILEKFIEKTGGRATYEKMQNRLTKGAVDFAAQGIKGTSTTYQARPNKLATIIDFPQFGKQQQGTDGTDAWEMSMMGPRLLEGEELATALRQAAFNSELRWKELYKEAKVVGVEDVNGKGAYKLELVPQGEGLKTTQFFDKESGMLVKSVTIAKGPAGELPLESIPDDWRDIDGIKIPFKTTVSAGVTNFTVILEEVKHNIEIPADTFAMPEEVKKLKESKAAAPAEAPAAEPKKE